MTMILAAACLAALSGAPDAAAVPLSAETQSTTIKPAKPSVRLLGGRGRLGVAVRDVAEEDVKTARLSTAAGALVEEVLERSAAEKAGVRKGDVIVEFDGERIRSARQLTRLVQETAEGRKVPFVVSRDGQRVTLSAEVTTVEGSVFDFRDLEDWGRNFRFDMPAHRVPTPRTRVAPPMVWRLDDLVGRNSGRLGITVETLSPQLAEYFGTKQGVLVTSVRDESTAAKAGLKAGDVITAVDGTTIDTPDELRRRLQGLGDGADFTIAVMRDKKAQTLKGTLESTVRRRTSRWTI